MTLRVNSIEYCHWQTSYSSCLEAVIIFSFLGEVGDILYRWSPAKSFPASSSTVVSWWPNTFLLGFLKATLPTEAVTVSLRVPLVASKFSLPIEAVTINMHLLSSSTWSDGVRGPASLNTNPVVGTTWVSTSIGLMAWLVSRSFWISTSVLVKRTMVSLPGGVSAGPSTVCLTSTLVGKVIGSAGGVSSLGGYLNDGGGVMCSPGFCRAWLYISDISCGGWGIGVPLWDHCILAYSFWGSTPQVPEDISLIKGDVPPHMLL